MTAIIDLPDCVLLFSDIVHHQTLFMVMRIKDGLPVATASDPAEFLFYMGDSYEKAILTAENLAAAHGVQVDDRIGTTAAEARP